jgi:hypothetical protein
MLLTAGMSACWWVEAICYAVYIHNRTPHKGIQMRTPYQMFYGKPHHPVPIKVFGCLALVYDHKNTKKDMDKTRRAAFLGVDTSGRCKFLDLSTKARFTADASEAAFYEDVFPLGKHNTSKALPRASGISENPLIFLLDDETPKKEDSVTPKKEDLVTRSKEEERKEKEPQVQNVAGSTPVVHQSPANPNVFSNSPHATNRI